MQYVRFGNTGMTVSRICLGTNCFDTANVYRMDTGEEITGRCIREFGLDRDEIIVATKVNFEMPPGRPNGGGLSRKNIKVSPMIRSKTDAVDKIVAF